MAPDGRRAWSHPAGGNGRRDRLGARTASASRTSSAPARRFVLHVIYGNGKLGRQGDRPLRASGDSVLARGLPRVGVRRGRRPRGRLRPRAPVTGRPGPSHRRSHTSHSPRGARRLRSERSARQPWAERRSRPARHRGARLVGRTISWRSALGTGREARRSWRLRAERWAAPRRSGARQSRSESRADSSVTRRLDRSSRAGGSRMPRTVLTVKPATSVAGRSRSASARPRSRRSASPARSSSSTCASASRLRAP